MYYVQYWNGHRATAQRRPVAKSAALMLRAQLRAMGMNVAITDKRGRIVPPTALDETRPDSQYD
jgi:hypothetical protein